MNKKIIIIGAGPTGIGAGYRLKEIGYKNFKILEKNDYIGGLSASFSRDGGYTVDIGGHVLFSHYDYFDKVVEDALQAEYLEHIREAWIWMQNKFVPYPFQNNIKFLPKEMMLECLTGLINTNPPPKTNNFSEWIYSVFGAGIAKYFMNPYNYKVWAHPLEMMSKNWIAERVSVIDLKHVLTNVILDKTETSWGPNNTFKFPKVGGTGEIFRNIAKKIQKHIKLNSKIIKIDTQNKIVTLTDGNKESYDILINTSPLDCLVKSSDFSEQLKASTQDLLFSNGYSVGIGFKRPLEEALKTKCWNYFPEENSPFYRVTYLSNYSPNMVPDIKENFLLMCETSYSEYKQHDPRTILKDTIDGLINSKFIQESDLEIIDFTDVIDIKYSYPIPSLNRDNALNILMSELEKNKIYSRGRFGQWRYETGNMDHSFMQGVEVINFIIEGKSETTRFAH